jgi:hypothetical protein
MVNHLDGFNAPYLLAGSDAPAAADAQVVISLVEGVFSVHRETPVPPAHLLPLQPDVVNHLLELALPVVGAEHAALGYRHVA